MKLVLDTVSKPVTGKTAKRVLRSVDSGSHLLNSKGENFIAEVLKDMKSRKKKTR